jgi:hypothetical protein
MSPQSSSDTRRTFLLAVCSAGAATLTGCSDRSQPDSAPPTERRTTPGQTTHRTADSETTQRDPTPDRVGTDYYRVEVTLSEVSAESIARGARWDLERLDSFERTLLGDAVANGSRTVRSATFEPLRERLYVTLDGNYYEITRSTVETERVEAHRLDIEARSTCPGETTVADSDPIAYENLPDRGATVFVRGLRDALDDDSCVYAGRTVYYSPDAATDSRFIDESPTTVQYDGETYDVRHDGVVEATRKQFRIEANRLGRDIEQATDAVLPDVVARLDDALDDPQQSFLERLVRRGTVSESGSRPAPLSGLIETLRSRAYSVPSRRGRAYYLEYDDTYYRFTVVEVEA